VTGWSWNFFVLSASQSEEEKPKIIGMEWAELDPISELAGKNRQGRFENLADSQQIPGR
jgi:hypothetical protein